MSVSVSVPVVAGVSLTPNPAAQSAALTIRVTVTEETRELQPYYYYSGDLYAGEV